MLTRWVIIFRYHPFRVCISTWYKEMSMSFTSTPPVLSLYYLTMPGYATLQWSSFLESNLLLVLLAFTVENEGPRITPLLSYHFATRNDEFKSIRLIKTATPWSFQILITHELATSYIIRAQCCSVAVDKIPMDCNLIRSGRVENQLSKKSRYFLFFGISSTNRRMILRLHIVLLDTKKK